MLQTLLNQTLRAPVIGAFARTLLKPFNTFPGSAVYWDNRYSKGGNSGVGSYGKFSKYKAEILNAFVSDRSISTVIEFGCGDGNQLSLAKYPEYIGVDVSEAAVRLCRQRYANDPTKTFMNLNDYNDEKAELALSLDVIFHLVEDDVFENYMTRLFASAERFIIIYSSNDETIAGNIAPHVRHRKFTRWVEENMPEWRLLEHIPNQYPYKNDYKEGSFADFFIYARDF